MDKFRKIAKYAGCKLGGAAVGTAGLLGSIYILGTDKIKSQIAKSFLAGFCYGASATAFVRINDLAES